MENLPAFNNADLILPNLWLGNYKASQDENFLRNAGIKTVFNCTKDLPFHHTVRIQYRVPIDDNLQEEEIRNMELWSREIVLKINKEYIKGNPILIHCAAGMQRSAASIAMFLIAYQNINTEQAIRNIKEKRPIAFYPSANFGRAILTFEQIYQKYLMNQINLLK